MTKRLLAVLAAVLIAAGVMVLAYTLGSPGVPRSVSDRLDKPDTTRLQSLQGLDDETDGEVTGDPSNPLKGADKGTYSSVSGGRRTVVTWDRMKQLPRGVSDVWVPQATITFAPDRAMTVRADRGTFVAPENQPRSGDLRGHVVVDLYQSDDGSTVDPTTAADRMFRITLDQAEFDLSLGQLDATGPVGVAGSGVDFRGRGLSLRYSQGTNRVERLVVAHGDTLTYTPAATAPDPSAATGQAALSDRPADSNFPTPRAPRFYRARFEDQVHIQAPRSQTTMDAQYLEAVFSPDTSAMSRSDADSGAAGHGSAPNSHPPSAVRDAPPAAATPQVTVQWAGQLVIVPEPTPPADLAGPRDVLLRLTSTTAPVRIVSHGDQTLQAGEVNYLASARRITAVGKPQAPLVIKAPQLGTLTGTRLTLNQADATAVVQGPGALLSAEGAEPLSVAWADRLDLAFADSTRDAGSAARLLDADADADAEPASPAPALGPLREAHFTSDVIARRRDFALDAGEAVLTFALGPEGNPHPDHLAATGDVRASRPNLQLTAQHLTATLTSGSAASAARPTSKTPSPLQSLTAENQVRVTLADRDIQLAAGRLTADPDDGTMTLYAAGTDHPATITRGPSTLTARRQVTLSDPDQHLRVTGAGALQTPLPNHVTDTARAPASSPATLQVTWRDAMDFDNPTAAARFVGQVVSQTQAPGQASELTADQLDLHFSQPTGKTTSVARPSAPETKPPRDTSNLSGDRTIRDATATGNVAFTARTFDENHPLLTGIRLAGPTMVFQNHPTPASRKAAGDGAAVSSDLPPAFGNTPANAPLQQVRVLGKGTLLLQDHRPPKPRSANPSEATGREPAYPINPSGATLTGRGDTLFTWAGQLTLDAARNDMILDQDVWMIHRPDAPAASLKSEGNGQKPDHATKSTPGQTASAPRNPAPPSGDLKPITLDCQHLLVDLEDTGGLGVWMNDNAPRTRINRVVADRRVKAAQGDRSILADHMTYAADRQVLSFTADHLGLVTVQQKGRPTAGRAEKVLWYLAPNRLEAIHPAGGMIPLPASNP